MAAAVPLRYKRAVGGNDERWELWRQNPIFAAAGEATCRELCQRYPARLHGAGQALVQLGQAADRVFVVLEGTVRIYQQAADGREVLVKLLRAPCVFGDLELLASLAMIKNVAALDDVLLAEIPAPDYVDLMLRHPRAMLAHMQQMAAAFCVAARNQRQVFATVEQRVANLLLSYADFYGAHEGEETVIDRPLTQQEIAQSLGAVRRSVAKVLSEWTGQGIVARRGQRLALLQVERLEELAAPIRGSLCFQMGAPLADLAQQEELQRAELEVVQGPGSLPGRRYPVHGELLIGRRSPSAVQLPDEAVDAIHCRVFRGSTGTRFWIEDLDSDNGTVVNGKPVRRAVLRDGDTIQVGSCRLRLCLRSS